MKRLVKAIVPRPLLDRAVEMRNRVGLATSPRRSFDPGNLCSAGTLRLPAVFGNADVDAAWEQDRDTIRSSFGDEDKMGGVNPGDRRALYYLIMALKPESVLEVGTHIGASTLHIARALKRLNGAGGMTSVDRLDVNDPERGPWKKLGLAKPPREFARELECLERIEFRAMACLELMRTTREKYDFVFLDGDHSARAVYQEVGAALGLLKPAGVILLHDYYPRGIALYPDGATIGGPFRALERIRRENPAIGVLPLGDLPWPTKQGKNVTTLALVVREGEGVGERRKERERAARAAV